MEPITVIGAGLAGCEAAWQIAKRGGQVILYEMKPEVYSPAHTSPLFAELVCSNSLKSESMENASGVLKEEMRQLDSLILKVAEQTKVPAGDALAVDRNLFSTEMTRVLEHLENVKIFRQEVTTIPDQGVIIVATGPLTSEGLSKTIQSLTGGQSLFFYDAIAPIVTAESVNFQKAFKCSRYGKGGEDYVNCPMEQEAYVRFVEALTQAEKVVPREFEKNHFFEGCLPIEEMAERGRETLAYGPLKPVGLTDPRTGRRPFAVVQLRQEDRFETMFNLVGFQTRLKYDEQKRVFRMIPGLEDAEFVRFGSMHRNTFIDAPRLLSAFLHLRTNPHLFFAGQITGVEGYMESTAMGLLAGLNAFRYTAGAPLLVPPPTTAMGALIQYITESLITPFQPMNINFGLFPPLPGKNRGRDRRRLSGKRAIEEVEAWKKGWQNSDTLSGAEDHF